MGRIRILSDDIANKIAAGEVVERPASVVKELLENSLDAGSSQLRIEVSGGGRRMIRITDDGCGMLRDDAMLAFERHATSKLASAKDLLSIATLGFRGEALPSIASVSRLVLETRSAEETTGTRVEIHGGKIVSCDEAALASGTQITVNDLFYNVPARKKFLRSEQTELAHIASLATHYSLAHPGKSFHLTSDSKELLNVAPVAAIRERVYQVFGAQVLDELVDFAPREAELRLPPPYVPPGSRESQTVQEGETALFRLSGFVSRPQVQKSNRNSIFLFVNRRLIRDRLLLHAISGAYHNLIPPSCFPFALLFLECDAEEVDVNVHPSKTEVRFRHSSFVHDFVRDSVRAALIESKPISSIPLPAVAQSTAQVYNAEIPAEGIPLAQPAANLPYSEFSQQLADELWKHSNLEDPAAVPGAVPDFALRLPHGPDPRLDFSGQPVRLDEPPGVLSRLPVPDTHGAFPENSIPDPSQSMLAIRDLRPLGQIHESFIVAAGIDGLWIVDQHVAHERILFEKVLKQRQSGRVEMQHLLMPLVLQLTPSQAVEYGRIGDELNQTGFATEPFGQRTLAVTAAPAGLGAADIEKVLFEILEIADRELRNVSVADLRRGIAASIACRAAIKVNMKLDQTKIEWLLKTLAETECPMSCPHGRPVALRYSIRDILKGFHRI